MDRSTLRSRWKQRWNQFFYSEEVPYGLAVVRIGLALTLLIPLLTRWARAREIFSADGATAPLWDSFGFPGLLPIPSGPMAVVLATLLGGSLVCLAWGWMTRTSAAIAGVLTAYLGMLDMLSTLTKYTCIATHALLLLSVSQCGSVWSIDAWLSRRRGLVPVQLPGSRTRYAIWPQRLIQIMLAVLYFACAITKMQTPQYMSGDLLFFWLLTNVNFANPIGEWMSLYPPMLVAMGLVTVTWEMVFPFICWRGLGKAAALGLGVVFHIMTAASLGLYIFPMVCLACYGAFLTESNVQQLAGWVRRFQRRHRWSRSLAFRSRLRLPAAPEWCTPGTSAMAWGAVLAIAIGLGLELEHALDPYRLRSGERMARTLRVISPERAAEMLSGTSRIHMEDKLIGFDVGTQTFGGRLADARTEFNHGQRAIIECAVVPPHEDLWLEVNLHDAQNRLIQRCGQIMTREKIRCHLFFEITPKYPVGDYHLVLQVEGREITRRSIAIRGDTFPNGSDRRTAANASTRPPATAFVR